MTIRPIEPLAFAEALTFQPVPTEIPTFVTADPTALYIDESYQREISPRGRAAIRRMVEKWDWRKFQPPLVSQVGDQYHVMDGQHEAIAAATRHKLHGDLPEIPLMLVYAPQMQDRADAFVGRNRDRIAVSAQQLHFAAVAAGDEEALTVFQVCDRAGIRILRVPTPKYLSGDTMAVKTIQRLVSSRHALGARRVLEPLAQAGFAPVTADQIKAVECVLFDDEYKGEIQPEWLVKALTEIGAATLERDGKVFAAGHNVRPWRGMAVVLFRKATKGKRKGAVGVQDDQPAAA